MRPTVKGESGLVFGTHRPRLLGMSMDAILRDMATPRAISPKQLRALLRKMGISQLELARRLGVDGRSVRRWLAGEAPVPGPARAAIQAMTHLDDLRRLLEEG